MKIINSARKEKHMNKRYAPIVFATLFLAAFSFQNARAEG